MRIRRHNNIVNYLAKRNLKGSKVVIEPRIPTNAGLRKPDLIITRGNVAYVVDVQITKDDGNALEDYHKNKIHYYKNNTDIKKYVLEEFHVDEVVFGAVTINYKGLWAKSSAEFLLNEKLISKSDLFIISTRVGIGSVIIFNLFYKTNSRQGPE